MWEVIGVWIAAFLTLAILSLVIKENPVYRFAEHIFVGVSAGYGVMNTFDQSIKPKILQYLSSPSPENVIINLGTYRFMGKEVPFITLEHVLLFIGVVLGIMILMKLEIFQYIAPQLRGLSLYSLAVIIGIGTGINLTAAFQGILFPQIQSTFLPLWMADMGTHWFEVFTNWVFVIGVITTLLYFFFSVEQKGIMKPIVNVGIVFIMVAFGASFGYTVMGRISLLLGRIYFLLHNWLHLI